MDGCHGFGGMFIEMREVEGADYAVSWEGGISFIGVGSLVKPVSASERQ